MRSESTKRVAAVLALTLGAAVMSGCANWRDEGRMGAGPMMKDDAAKSRGSAGPGTVMPSGTQGPSGSTGGAGTGTR